MNALLTEKLSKTVYIGREETSGGQCDKSRHTGDVGPTWKGRGTATVGLIHHVIVNSIF